jgi:2-dehydropantoate 2-reductase
VQRLGRDSAVRPFDIALVTVKSFQTREASARLREGLSEEGLIITLQNGLGNVEALCELFGSRRVAGGATTHAARRLPDGIRHVAFGETEIAPAHKEGLVRTRAAAERLSSHGLPVSVCADVGVLLWRKLVVSCSLNPVTAVLGVPNGAAAELEGARQLVEEAAREVAEVARRVGVELGPDPDSRALEVARRTATNHSSMLQDLEAGRRTELEALNGAICREGARLGVETPVNRALYAMMSAAETWARRGDAGEAVRNRQAQDRRNERP